MEALNLPKKVPKSVGDTYPVFVASPGVAGLPTTIFFNGTPLLAIYCTEVPLKTPVAFMNNYSYVS